MNSDTWTKIHTINFPRSGEDNLCNNVAVWMDHRSKLKVEFTCSHWWDGSTIIDARMHWNSKVMAMLLYDYIGAIITVARDDILNSMGATVMMTIAELNNDKHRTGFSTIWKHFTHTCMHTHTQKLHLAAHTNKSGTVPATIYIDFEIPVVEVMKDKLKQCFNSWRFGDKTEYRYCISHQCCAM